MAEHETGFIIVQNEKAKSKIWEYFGVKKSIQDETIEPNVAVCFQCSAEVRTAGGTSNMMAHAQRHHGITGLKNKRLSNSVENANSDQVRFSVYSI